MYFKSEMLIFSLFSFYIWLGEQSGRQIIFRRLEMLENFFGIKKAGSTVRTEIIAGLTTFFTMAYIIFVNPAILSNAGMDAGAVMVGTCIAAAVGTLIMALYANYPFAQASGMGLNAFFAYTICGTLGYSWQAGLAAVFISGIIFILLTLTGFREAIVKAIPRSLKAAISAGIGMFIAFIGVKNAGWLKFTVEGGHLKVGQGFFFGEFTQPIGGVSEEMANSTASIVTNGGIIPALDFTSAPAILALLGLVIIIALVVLKVKGALFIGLIATSVIGSIVQFGFGIDVGVFAPGSLSIPSLAPTFGKFLEGFGELFTFKDSLFVGILSIVSVLISLTLVDMFDTIGTLIGTAAKAKMLDEDGNLPRINKALLADSVATSVGAVVGVSTVTTYVESSAGVSEGGRTGLTSVVTAIMFLLAIVISPLLGLVPTAATAPVLVVVGIMMMGSLKSIDWEDFAVAAPAFLTMVMMAFGYSIADGIALGFISYSIIGVIRGKAKEVHPLLYIFSVLFIIRFFLIM